jgi:predicted  nucleic acid-binding Zn-ribbon protein
MGFAALAAAVMGGAGAADAGTILLARESTIRASGKAGADDFDLRDGSKDFNGFADMVDTANAGVVGPRMAANQHSRPAVGDGEDFTGAYAEGSARASADDDAAAPDQGQAVSNFDLTFEVFGVPSLVSFGGSVGVSGNGSTTVSLSNESTGEILLEQQLQAGDGEGQEIQHSTVLKPGVYELCVEALVNGDASESMAYYTVSLSIEPAGNVVAPPPAAIPLPPAAWAAASVMGAAGLLRGARKLRRATPAL